MKKIVILTSVLALAACGGGSGGGSMTWSNDTTITQDMLQNSRSAQSQEIAKKLETIAYVEDKLGSLVGEGGELHGTPNSNSNVHSATTNKMFEGLLLKDIEARYQEAVEYLKIINKVINANEESNITNRDIAIAYSLSNGVCYDEPETKEAIQTHFGISIEEQTEETTVVNINLLVVNIQVTITEQVKNNEELKEAVTEEVTKEVPVLKPEEPETPNEEEPEKPISIDETRFTNMNLFVADDFDQAISFNVENGVIKSVFLVDDEVGTFSRKDNTSVYSNEGVSFRVTRTFPVYMSILPQDPRTNEQYFQELTNSVNYAIEQDWCSDTCVTVTQAQLANNTYTVTQREEGDYLVEFMTEDTWSDMFVSKSFAENNLNTIKGQQLFYLVSREVITEERADEIRSDNTITNLLDIEGICPEFDTCKPTLQAITDGRVAFVDSKFDANIELEDTPELSYASFGALRSKISYGPEEHDMITLLAGGDATKKVDVTNINENMEFRGKAIGVAFKENPHGEEALASEKFTTNNATLSINGLSKAEMLTMPFASDGNNYYNVTVTRTGQDADPQFSFTDGNNVPESYQIHAREGNEGHINTVYFGDNNVASEVSGAVRYEERNENDDFVGFEGAFGMKKVENGI